LEKKGINTKQSRHRKAGHLQAPTAPAEFEKKKKRKEKPQTAI
jgi:hypothetical protein